MNITFVQSPNFDSNRKPIDRIIIHWIVGNLAAADAVFKKSGSTSAHYGVEEDTVHQYVKEDQVAYHAGNYAMNQRSIGIEHSADPNRPASTKTYETSAQLIAHISTAYKIPLDRTHILRHGEVVPTQCCGTVDVDKLISLAKKYQGGDTVANYKGYDLSNPESMKVAVDILVRVQAGEFVDKPKYDVLEKEAIELRKRPASCPPADPKALKALQILKDIKEF